MTLTSDEEHRNSNCAEQLCLLSPQELRALESLLSLTPAPMEVPSSKSDGSQKPRGPEGSATQDELPFRI